MPTNDELKLELIGFQIERLKRTYRDFMDDPESHALAKFFLEDVYSTRDKSERDAGFKAVYDSFKNKLGKDLVANLFKMIRLNDLTDRLDDKMVRKLQDLGIGIPFTEDEYEEAYYLCDNYDDRVEQLELIAHAVEYFHKMSRHRSIGLALMMIRPYALLRGARVLMDFIQDGYRAFRSVPDVTEFAKAIRSREMERLDRIYSLGRRAPSVAELRHRARELGIKGADRMTIRRLMKEMHKWS